MTIKKYNRNTRTICRKFISGLIGRPRGRYFISGVKMAMERKIGRKAEVLYRRGRWWMWRGGVREGLLGNKEGRGNNLVYRSYCQWCYRHFMNRTIATSVLTSNKRNNPTHSCTSNTQTNSPTFPTLNYNNPLILHTNKTPHRY